jgi:hypothetical protein
LFSTTQMYWRWSASSESTGGCEAPWCSFQCPRVG